MNSWTGIVTHFLQDSQLAAVFLDTFLKSLVVLAIAGGVCICWRRSSASVRHLVWFLAVAGVLFLPGFSSLLPGWQKPLWAVRSQGNPGNEITLTLELAPARANTVWSRQTPSPEPEGARPGAVWGQAAGGQRFAAHVRAGWAAMALAIWAIGVVLNLLRVAGARLRLRSLRRAAHPAQEPEWHALLRRLCRDLGVGRRIALLLSARNVMPVTWGWCRPVVLLPSEAGRWSPERRRVVLLHELAHVKRWDCLTQLIARLACAIYWFNPLVWVAARRMCIERERACDDLVLNGGCKASDYADHLVEIARTFRRVPQVAAIAMARSSHLEGRIAAIVDASRVRREPRALLVGMCSVAGLALVAAAATQKLQANSPATPAPKPWFEARLRAFFTAKAAQAHRLAEQDKKPLAPEVWPYYDAGMKGDWQNATNLWWAMRQRAGQYENTKADEKVCSTMVWSTILETDLAWEQFANWKEKYVLAFGNDIIKSIPPGSIYLGGTDPGRGVITAMCESHTEGKPFFTLTQNALADAIYLKYLRAMYGPTIYTPTDDDSKKSFDEYLADAQRRLAGNKLKPGEDVRTKEGKVQVSGQVAVMSINGLLTKVIFDRNPDREFYIEESFPLDWMYPHLSPHNLIMKINRQPLPALSDEIVQGDHDYWVRYLQPMIGDWLNYDTPVAEVATFVKKTYLNHDLSGFTGDREWVEDTWAQKAFSKLRCSIGGIYQWRSSDANGPAERQRMAKEADFAFRQAYALCPTSPEALFRYVNLLLKSNRVDDARLLAETTLELDPQNPQVRGLAENLKNFKPK